MKMIKNIEEFEILLENEETFLIDFFAEWCGPCKMIAPFLEEIEKEHDDVSFLKVDVDQLPELAKRYGVMSIPTIYTFKKGQVVTNVTGFQPKPTLEKLVKDLK